MLLSRKGFKLIQEQNQFLVHALQICICIDSWIRFSFIDFFAAEEEPPEAKESKAPSRNPSKSSAAIGDLVGGKKYDRGFHISTNMP